MTFPRYPKYKDSGVEWLGEVPEYWGVNPFRRHLLAPLTNGIFKKKDDFGSGTLLINVFDIFRNDFRVDAKNLDRVICTVEEQVSYRVENGDLFFVRSSLKQEGIAVVAMANNPEESMVYECHLIRARPNSSSLNSRFASYLFNSALYRAQFIKSAKITTMTTIDQGAIKSIEIVIPAIAEQTKITAFLDKETAKIDALIAEQDKLVEQLKRKMECLVLSAIVSNDTYETRLIHVVDIISRPVELVPNEIYTAIGLYNRGRGLFHKEPREMAEMGDSDFFRVVEGDLIISGQFAWEGAVAMATNNENQCVVSHRYPVLNGKPGVAITEYIYALFSTKHGDFLLNENSRGAAGRNRPLNINALMKEKIKIPAMSVQIKIADIVNKEREVRNAVKMQKKLLEERRSALISAAVTGKIDVRNSK